MPATSRRVPLSILDLAPRSQGMTPADALQETTKLAELADELGYHRYWMAEHHGSDAFMSSATSVLLGHLAHHTTRIRLGSGGVMLPNHSALMVAEYYGTLATLHGDRFDLGLGRAPGTDPQTAAALRRNQGQLDTFATDVGDLAAYLGEPRANARVRAIPGEGTRVPLWMLGSSTGGAQVAALLGLPFSFASHFAPELIRQAIDVYRNNFRADVPTAQVSEPTVMAGALAMVAPSQEEAEYLFTTNQLLTIRNRTGQRAPLDPPVHDLAEMLPEELVREVPGLMGFSAVGTPGHVVDRLQGFADENGLDELIIITYAHDPELRRRSYRLLADEWGLGR